MKMNEQRTKYQKTKEKVAALKGFYVHISVYVIVNLGLLLINMMASPGRLWFFWPLVGWGIAIVLHAMRVFGGTLGSNWEEKKIAELMEKE
jgi:hypothetical protein